MSENNRFQVIKIYKDKKEEELEEASKKMKWTYNNRSELEYKKYGLTPPDNMYFQVKRFIASVDPKGKYVPIRSVKKIIRCRAPDWEDKYHREKEYLYYYEDAENAKDWLGRPIKGYTSHLHGIYDEIVLEDVIDRNGDLQGHKMAGTRKKYYLPFSKEQVDKIIATSDNTDKNNISFVFKGPEFRTEGYTYEQFVNSNWQLMEEMQRSPGGPRMFEHYQKEEVKHRQEGIRKTKDFMK